MMSADHQALLARYVEAFERYDIDSPVSLLHEDAMMSMPPYNFWLRGTVEMGRWFLGVGSGCRGSRLVATAANGSAAFGSYRPDGQGGHQPFALQVIEVSGVRIVGHHNFLDTNLFPAFGLPPACSPDPPMPVTIPSRPARSSGSDNSAQAWRIRTEQSRRWAASCSCGDTQHRVTTAADGWDHRSMHEACSLNGPEYGGAVDIYQYWVA
jgi:hypothetical protein